MLLLDVAQLFDAQHKLDVVAQTDGRTSPVKYSGQSQPGLNRISKVLKLDTGHQNTPWIFSGSICQILKPIWPKILKSFLFPDLDD